jgi:hypothetical protein
VKELPEEATMVMMVVFGHLQQYKSAYNNTKVCGPEKK